MLQSWDLDKGHKLNVHLTTTQKDLADLVTFTEKYLMENFVFCAVFVQYMSFVQWVNTSIAHGLTLFPRQVWRSLSPGLLFQQVHNMFWNWTFYTSCLEREYQIRNG